MQSRYYYVGTQVNRNTTSYWNEVYGEFGCKYFATKYGSVESAEEAQYGAMSDFVGFSPINSPVHNIGIYDENFDEVSCFDFNVI